MRELFSDIISLQLGASIAIVLLLLSRRLMKKRYVAKLCYWLWLMVALRLCLPIDVNVQFNRRASVNIPMQDYYVSAYTDYKVYDDNGVIVFEDGTQIVYDTTARQISDKSL